MVGLAAALCLAAGEASALSIFLNSASAPELAGSVAYDFDDQADDTYFTSTTVFGGQLTINANNGQLWFDDQWSTQFGTTGISLDTNNNVANDFEFVFTSEVSAFGFAVNALDVDWTMEIFDTSDALIDTFTIPNQVALGGFNRRGFAGAFSDSPIKRVRVRTLGGSDRALIDNIRVSVVPEPGTATLIWLGLLGLVAGSSRAARGRTSTGSTSNVT